MNKFLLASLLSLACTSSFAQVLVSDAWVRATVSQQKATGAFMQLSSAKGTRLIDARSPVARTEIHEMAVQDHVMRMRQINGLDLPAGQNVMLKPGGYHIMFFDLKQPVKEGDVIPLTLIFEDKDKQRETLELQVPARALNSAAKH
ncbi:hypothetical protein DBR37_03620 [Herminiimonas sp. KBW02]|uniref:copper chaperone PCu(A)C n=1 Tax=Herminiimonas sp. KBW02 TaxID=2153363 RepID=UPI000F5B1713|nr:copper chaperone PCu(A)C [Herminiimonas sp. KBW02]RQO37287.1 hypothetical protein DBR37_03620 [Herminiimonas sp. KBW02]